MLPADEDDVLGRMLGELPGPRAPRTLLPRVLADAERWSRRPWYSRAWFTWPLGWQLLSLAVVASVFVALALLKPVQADFDEAARHLGTAQFASLERLLQPIGTALNGCLVLWRALVEPLAPYALGLVVCLCFVCALFATALDRLVLGRL